MLFVCDIPKPDPYERSAMFLESEEEARARRSQQIVARFEQKQLHGRAQQQKKETRFVGTFVVALAAITAVVLLAVVIEGQIVAQTRTPAEEAARADPADPAVRQAAAAAVRRLPPRPSRPPPSPPSPRSSPPPSLSPSPPPSPLGPPPSPSPSPPPRPPGEAPLKQRTCSVLIHGLRISLLDNQRCEDGGTDSVSSVCALGTDYGDCNPR